MLTQIVHSCKPDYFLLVFLHADTDVVPWWQTKLHKHPKNNKHDAFLEQIQQHFRVWNFFFMHE